jgi:hypothetical protein
MDKLLNANARLPGRYLPPVGVASRSSTRRRGRAPLMLTRLPSFRSGRAALRVLTRSRSNNHLSSLSCRASCAKRRNHDTP